MPQGLKPSMISPAQAPGLQRLRKNREQGANHQADFPQGLKPVVYFAALAARLKPCPYYRAPTIRVFPQPVKPRPTRLRLPGVRRR